MARKEIKGITIEIGGDVTKLDKALSSVDKSLKDTQAKLKDVDKLLRFDPKNVELLGQKQRLLSQAVEQTSNKYETLKRTLEESTVSNDKYDVWTKAHAALQGEITKTENALKSLEQEQKQLAGLNLAPDSDQMLEVQERIDATKEKLGGLQQKVKDTYEALGRPITIDQYDALQRELIETERAAKDACRAADEFNPSLEILGATMDKVSDKAGKAADKTRVLSAAAAVGAAALVGIAVSAGKAADEINTLSQQSGFSTETIQGWNYAADRIDVSADTIIGAARRLKKNMTSASADVQEAFKKLNISMQGLSSRSMEEVFDAVVGGLSMIRNETERDILAMTLFGKSADDLAGIIDDGGAALRAYQQEARDLGLILSQDALDGANAFNDGLDEIKSKAQAAFLEAGASLAKNLLPELESLVKVVSKVLSRLAQLDGGTLRLILTITMLVALISPIARLISNVTGAISGITSVASLFSATAGNSVYMTFAKWAIIIAAVIAAVTLLIALIGVLTGKGDEMNATLDRLNNSGGKVGGNLTGGSVRGFASGGVFEPNSPMLAVLGDNKTEREIAAPESTLRELMRDELSGYRTSGSVTRVNVQFAGSLAQLGRVLQPVVTAETARRGPGVN